MDILLISGIISLLALDTTIAFQIMISSPIFACPLLGWMLGDVALGFELGALFQLLWLGKIPAGAVSTPEGNLASMVVTALVISQQNLNLPNTTLAVYFAEGIVLSYIGAKITIIYRKFNGKLLQLLINRMERLQTHLLWLAEIWSMISFAAVMFIFVAVIIKLNLLYSTDFIKIIGGMFEGPFVVVKPIIWGLGVVAILPIIQFPGKQNQGKQ